MKVGETVIECIQREIKEETSLNCDFFNTNIVYKLDEFSEGYKKIKHEEINVIDSSKYPIFISNKKNGELSLMYLLHGIGELKADMETQGILFLRGEDIKEICTKKVTFSDYKNKGGKYLLTEKLGVIDEYPEDFILIPKTQLLFLNKLFDLEPELIKKFEGNNLK